MTLPISNKHRKCNSYFPFLFEKGLKSLFPTYLYWKNNDTIETAIPLVHMYQLS